MDSGLGWDGVVLTGAGEVGAATDFAPDGFVAPSVKLAGATVLVTALGFAAPPAAGAEVALTAGGFVAEVTGLALTSTAGLSGTEGSLCARISAARTLGSGVVESRCSFFVITRTSSRWFKAAAGWMEICRNSDPFETLATVPITKPLGKI